MAQQQTPITNRPGTTEDTDYGHLAIGTVPDCEHVDWDDVPRVQDQLAESSSTPPVTENAMLAIDKDEEVPPQWRRIVRQLLADRYQPHVMADPTDYALTDLTDDVDLQALVTGFKGMLSDLKMIIKTIRLNTYLAEGFVVSFLKLIDSVEVFAMIGPKGRSHISHILGDNNLTIELLNYGVGNDGGTKCVETT
ncbi:hypothetical protein BJX64DRAFT_285283 [Aspergillus heterothallicus]